MRYLKMNGAGNDFVILDVRKSGRLTLSPDAARAIADREAGVGCDQIIAMERSTRGDAFMRIWNADGGEVEACGNAARCVGWLLMQETNKPAASIENTRHARHDPPDHHEHHHPWGAQALAGSKASA